MLLISVDGLAYDPLRRSPDIGVPIASAGEFGIVVWPKDPLLDGLSLARTLGVLLAGGLTRADGLKQELTSGSLGGTDALEDVDGVFW
jgi:hypothetical protein